MTTSGYRNGEALSDRGHWVAVIRPEPLQERRVDRLGELEAILGETSVQLRGWDYPHIDRHSPVERGTDYISQSSRWNNYLEDWRLYKSGQFAGRTSLPEDWVEGSPAGWRIPRDFETVPYVGVGEILFRSIEILHFARNLAISTLAGSATDIRIKLNRTQGRTLFVDDPSRWQFSHSYSASVESIEHEYSFMNDELLAKPTQLGIDASLNIFELFGWEPESLVLEGWVEKVLSL